MIVKDLSSVQDKNFFAIIIGSGPAGICTALELERKKIKSLIIEAGDIEQNENDLNYLYFDALYLNLPLIHNSHTLRNYGYYYPHNDIEIASNQLHEIIENHEKNISEYRSQLVAKGSGVIIPYAMVRQQNQEFKNGKWVPLNFNVFIYPKYDCNLYEFHQNNFRRFNDDILQNILENCLIRK